MRFLVSVQTSQINYNEVFPKPIAHFETIILLSVLQTVWHAFALISDDDNQILMVWWNRTKPSVILGQ